MGEVVEVTIFFRARVLFHLQNLHMSIFCCAFAPQNNMNIHLV